MINCLKFYYRKMTPTLGLQPKSLPWTLWVLVVLYSFGLVSNLRQLTTSFSSSFLAAISGALFSVFIICIFVGLYKRSEWTWKVGVGYNCLLLAQSLWALISRDQLKQDALADISNNAQLTTAQADAMSLMANVLMTGTFFIVAGTSIFGVVVFYRNRGLFQGSAKPQN